MAHWLQILIAFGTGIYIGTYYDCKPLVEQAMILIDKYKPKQK